MFSPDHSTVKKDETYLEINLNEFRDIKQFMEIHGTLIKDKIAKLSPENLLNFLSSMASFGFHRADEEYNCSVDGVLFDHDLEKKDWKEFVSVICSELEINFKKGI